MAQEIRLCRKCGREIAVGDEDVQLSAGVAPTLVCAHCQIMEQLERHQLAQAHRLLRYSRERGLDANDVWSGRVEPEDMDELVDAHGEIVPEEIDVRAANAPMVDRWDTADAALDALGMVQALERDDADGWWELWATAPNQGATLLALTGQASRWGRRAAEEIGISFAEFLAREHDYWRGRSNQ